MKRPLPYRILSTLKWAWRHRLLISFLIFATTFTTEFALFKIPKANAAYTIANSARFISGNSDYLSRTPGSASNLQKWTFSVWIKPTQMGKGDEPILEAFTDANNKTVLELDGDKLTYATVSGGSVKGQKISSALFRDPAHWYHLVAAFDTTQSVSANRNRFYIDGTEITAWGTNNDHSLNDNTFVDSNVSHYIGRRETTPYSDLYMSDIYLIDGQQLGPTSFGQTDANGYWRPKAYTGTYGTNGFHLNFSNGASLGTDSSGNGNSFTVNGLAATDQVIDTPTNSFAVWSPVDHSTGSGAGTPSNGNLKLANTGGGAVWQTYRAGFFPSSGKFYWEYTVTSNTHEDEHIYGVAANSSSLSQGSGNCGGLGTDANSYGLCFVAANSNINKINNNTATALTTTGNLAVNDVVMVALDYDAGKLWFGRNCSWFDAGAGTGNPAAGTNPTFTGLSGAYAPGLSIYNGNSGDADIANFGQGGTTTVTFDSASGGSFYCTPPAGFKALSTANLPVPTIAQPNKYFDAKTYTGNGSTQSIIGLNFQPDLVWLKDRTSANNHGLFDSVRGATKYLSSNLLAAETTDASSLTSFDSAGFSLGTTAAFNTNTNSYISWLWKKSPTTDGVDIVTYTGNGSAHTISHSLGVAPQFIIIKKRSAGTVNNWVIGNSASGWTGQLYFDTGTFSTNSGSFNNTAPTASVFTVGTDNTVNENTQTFIAYLFAPISGFSQFGSYTGNGSADGPFVYTGFKPRYVMIKSSTDGTGSNWVEHDSARDTYNPAGTTIFPNLTQAEQASNNPIDILANGFKVRSSGNDSTNVSGQTYIYAAFADVPFYYSAQPAASPVSNAAVSFLIGTPY